MASCWCLTDGTKFCLTAVSCKSLGPKLQTLAGTAAWHLTVQGIAAGTSTSMSWVQIQLFLICWGSCLESIKLFELNMSHIRLSHRFNCSALPSFFSSFSHYCWVRSWWFCRGGDSNSEQSHLSVVWSSVLPSCSHHLAQGRHSVWVQS